MRTHQKKSVTVAVIIPTYNEQDTIDACLSQNALQDFDQIIVVDGGSSDTTVQQLTAYSHIVSLPTQLRNRAKQMNHAAEHTDCDVLLFLHADTLLPPHAAQAIRDTIESGHACGCFRRHFTPASPLLHVTSRLAYWRSKWLFWSYGDQALFFTKTCFQQLQGFQPMRHMEDLDICLRAKKCATHAVIDTPIQTSARRFADAPLKRLVKDAALSSAFVSGLYRPPLA